MLASRIAQPVPCELDAITSNRESADMDMCESRGIALRPSRTWPPDRLTTVLFDLDDTLIDSFNARVVALYQVFESFDIRDQAASEFMRGSGGKQLKTALAELETKLGISVGLYESYRESYWTKFTDTIRPYSGVKQLLSEIKDPRIEYRRRHPKEPRFPNRRAKCRRREGA